MRCLRRPPAAHVYNLQQHEPPALQSGGIPPLVRLLRDDPDEIAAELAAVVLRNLALQNPANRAAIKDAGGLQPLLRLLSMGQDKLVYPVGCEARVGLHVVMHRCLTNRPALL